MNEKSRTAAERARVELSLPIQMITLSASARRVNVVVVVVYVSAAGREFHNAAPRCVVFTFYYLLPVVRVCVSVCGFRDFGCVRRKGLGRRAEFSRKTLGVVQLAG